MDPQYIPYFKIFISALLGFIIGLERKSYGKCVGPRTYSLICMGACAFTLVSIMEEAEGGSYRMAGQIISGIGFLGAGVIWKFHDHISGITTAASVWVSASIGMLVGFEHFGLAMFMTLMIVFFLRIPEDKLVHKECESKEIWMAEVKKT